MAEKTTLSTVELAAIYEPWWIDSKSVAARKLVRLGFLERCGGDLFRTEKGREELMRQVWNGR